MTAAKETCPQALKELKSLLKDKYREFIKFSKRFHESPLTPFHFLMINALEKQWGLRVYALEKSWGPWKKRKEKTQKIQLRLLK